jgi:hypothetical protein
MCGFIAGVSILVHQHQGGFMPQPHYFNYHTITAWVRNFPPKAMCQGLVTSLWYSWKLLEHLRGGAWLKKLNSERVHLKGIWEPHCCLLSSVHPGCHKWAALFHHMLTARSFASPEPKSVRPSGIKWKLRNHSSFYVVHLRYFVTATES